MNFLKLSLLLLCSVFNTQAAELKTNYVTFGVTEKIIKLFHQEISPATNFKSLSQRTTIQTFSIRAGVEKEIFAEEVISFNLGGGGGYMLG